MKEMFNYLMEHAAKAPAWRQAIAKTPFDTIVDPNRPDVLVAVIEEDTTSLSTYALHWEPMRKINVDNVPPDSKLIKPVLIIPEEAHKFGLIAWGEGRMPIVKILTS